MADVSCQIESGNTEPWPGLTVGQRFVLRCEGSWPVMDPQSLELRLAETDKNKLKLFAFNPLSPGLAELQVTSYVPGQHDLKAVQLVDAQNSVVLNNLKFEVISVQDPQQPAKEPIPPIGPLVFFPWAVVVALMGVVLALMFGVLLAIVRRRLRARLLNEVIGKAYQYPPLPELYRELRALQRKHLFLTDPKASSADAPLGEILDELNQVLRIYLTRVYLIPAHRWPSKRTTQELSVIFGTDSELSPKLAELLRELDRAHDNRASIKGADLEQILRLLRNWVDQSSQWSQKQSQQQKNKSGRPS